MKKIIRTYLISAITVYCPYLLIVLIGLIQDHGANGEIGSSLPELATVSVLLIPTALIYGFFITACLYVFSLIDKRVLNKWFVMGFSLYSFLSSFIIQHLWYSVASALVPLIIAVIIMKKLPTARNS